MTMLQWRDDPRAVDTSNALILLPSLGTTTGIFDELVQQLRRRSPGLAILRADLPGHGTAGAADTVSIASLGDEVAETIATITARHVTVAGVSMGGAVALEAAARRPAHLDCFVMINSGARFGTPQGWQNLIGTVRASGLAATAAEAKSGWFSPAFADTPRAGALLREMADIDPHSYIACCRALEAYRPPDDLQSIEMPARLIATADDAATPPAGLRDLARQLRHASFHELPAGRHLSLIEHADTVAALIAPRTGGDRADAP